MADNWGHDFADLSSFTPFHLMWQGKENMGQYCSLAQKW